MYEGITNEEAEKRQKEGRVNRQSETATDSYGDIIRKNVLTYFNLINTVLFIVVLFTGKPVNGLFYMTVIFNSLIGIFQEIRAKRLLDGLRIMIAAKYDVCRSGEWVSLNGEEITDGDLIRLSAGMQVPADAQIVKGRLELNESMMTGESETVSRGENNHIYAGTIITSGSAEAMVLRVGKECLSSHIIDDAKKAVRTGSKLHDDMEKLIKIVSAIILPAGGILFLAQYYMVGMEWREAALKTTAAVVGMIPEGLVVLTSIALAVGTIRLSRRKVLVQDLYAIETLARTDVICLDKTGTLTEGKMQVSGIVMVNDTDPDEFARCMKAYLGAVPGENMTSSALKEYFGSENAENVTDTLPFSSDRKYAAAAFAKKGTYYLGSLQNLFPVRPATLDCIDPYIKEGNRVIVFAHSSCEAIPEDLPQDLQPLGFVLISDILRQNAADIMKYFEQQGITVYIISGDHHGTVSALAARAGVPGAENSEDLSVVPADPSFFEKTTEKNRVFGRVMPADKKNIIQALQKKGHYVAMTGDGVNDVSALNIADIGVSFAAATQAARDSADVILMSDDFAQLPSVINEGRRVINNIGRASSMYLVKTVFSVLLIIFSVLLRQEYPFLPVQLTLISSFGVGLPTFFMQLEPSFEKEQGDFLRKAFRNAVPSSVTVLCMMVYCMITRNLFSLTAGRYYAQAVILTFCVYVFTLLKVCRPLTRWRMIIILSVTAAAALVLFSFPDLFSVTLTAADIPAVGVGILLIYPCVKILEILYDKYADKQVGEKI